MPTLLRSLLQRRHSFSSTTRSPFSQLPLDIVFLIIDQFKRDTLQLRRFCLVSRAWSFHAQALLFRDVFVRSKASARFLSLLRTNTDVGRYISSLTVIDGYCSGWLRYQDEPNVLDSRAVKKLPNLRTLNISYLSFSERADAPFSTAGTAGWGSVSHLQIHFCRFATTHTMVAFIASFPRLESLDVFQCYTLDVGVRAHEKPAQVRIAMPAWHLKYLAFGEFPHNALIDWMIAEPADLVVDHLRILSLGLDASAFNAFLEKIGGSLKHLELPGMHRWGAGPGPSTSDVPLSIRTCTALTTLSFSERSAYDLGRGIISILSQVASPHLSTVSILIHCHLNAGYLDVPWEEIEDMLTTEAFGQLETVLINIWGGGGPGSSVMTPYEEAVLLMEDRLVILEARGLLKFKCVDWDPDDTAGRRLCAVPPRQTRQPLRRRMSRKVAGWLGRRE